MALIVSRPKYDIPPEGTYNARVSGINAVDDERYGQRFRFQFTLDEICREDGSPMTVLRSTSRYFTQNSRLTEIVQNILGRQLTPDELEEFDLESLIDSYVQIEIEHRQSESGNVYAVVKSIKHLVDHEKEDLPF